MKCSFFFPHLHSSTLQAWGRWQAPCVLPFFSGGIYLVLFLWWGRSKSILGTAWLGTWITWMRLPRQFVFLQSGSVHLGAVCNQQELAGISAVHMVGGLHSFAEQCMLY